MLVIIRLTMSRAWAQYCLDQLSSNLELDIINLDKMFNLGKKYYLIFYSLCVLIVYISSRAYIILRNTIFSHGLKIFKIGCEFILGEVIKKWAWLDLTRLKTYLIKYEPSLNTHREFFSCLSSTCKNISLQISRTK